jgi:hypothetical protein
MSKPRHFRVTCNDAIVPRRWVAGEVGVEVPGNLSPYFCKLELPGTVSTTMFNRLFTAKRAFYFYENEVELVEELDEKKLGSEVA